MSDYFVSSEESTRFDIRTFVLYNKTEFTECSVMFYIWDQIRYFFRRKDKKLTFELDTQSHLTLQRIAEKEQRFDSEIAAELLADALERYTAAQDEMEQWNALSPREKDVAALICLNYTNQQIAYHLHISIETVKTYVRNVLHKFSLRAKSELQVTLADWDFSDWE